MSKLPVQHRPRSFFPELSEIFEGFPFLGEPSAGVR